MMIFHVGDRVRAISEYMGNQKIINQIGTIIRIDLQSMVVEFDNDIDGHDGGFGTGKYGYCWCFPVGTSCLQIVSCALGDTVMITCSESAYTDFLSWMQQNAPEYVNRYKKHLKPSKKIGYELIKKAPVAEFFPLNQKMLCLIGQTIKPFSVFIVPEEDIYRAGY